jgi:hypothetical protein
MALNPDSEALKSQSGIMPLGLTRLNILGWLGNSIAVYAEEDPFWDELAKAENPEEFAEQNLQRLPVVLQVEVRDPLKLAAFLTGIRALAESAAPELTVWETRKHRDQAYVRVARSRRPNAEQGFAGIPDFALHYVPGEEVLIVSLNEDVLKKALDRRADRIRPAEKGNGEKVAKVPGPQWLGKNVAVHLDRRALLLYDLLSGPSRQRQMQELAWKNLPILNHWHRHYPQADPVKLHEQTWHQQLVCPGGGTYRWNDRWQTMESSVYGHPGEPKKGPTLAESMQQFTSADFGLTFEEHGLRAKAVLLQGGEAKTAAAIRSDGK